eukprot:2815445-Pleurochrysis_carterae.AAC.2
MSTRLRHSVNVLFDAAYARSSIGTEGGVPRWCMTVDCLVLFQVPLQVSGDEVPTSHAHAGGIGNRRECA